MREQYRFAHADCVTASGNATDLLIINNVSQPGMTCSSSVPPPTTTHRVQITTLLYL